MPDTFRIAGTKNKRFVIVGELEESERVSQILRQTKSKVQSIVFLAASDVKDKEEYVGTINQLDQVIDIQKIDEVIFCAKNITAATIISKMLQLEGRKLDFKIAQPETSFLIGSNSIDSQGDLYVLDINQINKPANRRNKRIGDVVVGLISLVLSPLICWKFKDKRQFLKNMFQVVIGKVSLVGYATIQHSSNLRLPQIKRGILPTTFMVDPFYLGEDAISRLNLIYAKNHTLFMDLTIVFKHFWQLDKK
jgi:hypothetical protein